MNSWRIEWIEFHCWQRKEEVVNGGRWNEFGIGCVLLFWNTNVRHYFLNGIVIVWKITSDSIWTNAKKEEREKAPNSWMSEKRETNKQRLLWAKQINRKKQQQQRRNFTLLAAVWSFHYEDSSKVDDTKKCRQDLRLSFWRWICSSVDKHTHTHSEQARDKNLRSCVSNKRDAACDSNEWHLFIPCHWLISHCFCFTIKIFTRSPFTRSYKFLPRTLYCRARFEFVCDAKIK